MTGSSALLPLIEKYFEKDPITAARHLETLEESEVLQIIQTVPAPLAARIAEYVPPAIAAILLPQLPKSMAKAIIDKLETQRATTILLDMPPDTRQNFIEFLSEKKKHQIQDMLSFPEDSAGRMMQTHYLAFQQDLKIKDTVRKIKNIVQKGQAVSYVYVINQNNQLLGVLNMRDLLLGADDTTLESIMRKDVYRVNCFQDRETVANELSTLKYFAAPVVDNEDHLLGIIKAEQLLSGIQEAATEDLQKMFGAGGDERAFSPTFFSLKKRLPWLHINLATAFLAAGVIAMFESIIAKITILAVFLPVVAGQGGNAGAQSLAVVMRGLVMREIPVNKAKNLIFKEFWIGIVNGMVIGLVTGIVVWLWHGNYFLGVVIGLGMLVNLALAGLAGAAIPLIMKGLGWDPAQASNIILTTVTDVVGFFAFLGFAMIFQNQL